MNERERMLRNLSSYDFAITELHIYLDTHPNDAAAADALAEYEAKSRKLTAEYEEKFGPLTASGISGNRWAWISDPWPWNRQGE
ncbi:MAG: spore coat protein CotJB [Acutalibacteraceae bacterium]